MSSAASYGVFVYIGSFSTLLQPSAAGEKRKIGEVIGRLPRYGSVFDVSKLGHMNYHGAVFALLSAALFGASTPAAKALLGSIDPAILAGILYCGAGVDAAVLRRLTPALIGSSGSEAALAPRDWPWRGGAIVLGGIVGPLLAAIARSLTAMAALECQNAPQALLAD